MEEAATGSYRINLIWLPKRATIKALDDGDYLYHKKPIPLGPRPLFAVALQQWQSQLRKGGCPQSEIWSSEAVSVTGPLHCSSSTAYHGHEMLKALESIEQRSNSPE